MTAMDINKRIEFVERKVLLCQDRIIQLKERASATVRKLSRELANQEDIKKEWIRKITLEHERLKNESQEATKLHRHNLDDLRIKYEEERQNKLRELKTLIQEEDSVIADLQAQRDQERMLTKTRENEIRSKYQSKIQEVLREEQAAMRTSVVRQKRILEPLNIYSMQIGMKKRNSAPMRKI